MTVQAALRAATAELRQVSPEARLEAELLLGHTLGASRLQLYQRLTEALAPGAQSAYQGLIARRLEHEPAPHILGRKEFFGLELEVSPAALIPRPETELLVELALASLKEQSFGANGPLVIDVGTGCGAIALALAANAPANARIIATDISRDALVLAQGNALRHGLAKRVAFLQADLVAGVAHRADLIVANLPYVSTRDWQAAPAELRHEPRIALDGGPDGLRVIARLLCDAPSVIAPGGAVLLEIGDGQGSAAEQLAKKAFPQSDVAIHRDLSGLERILTIRT